MKSRAVYHISGTKGIFKRKRKVQPVQIRNKNKKKKRIPKQKEE
jgi:hypothetical protein